MQISGKGNQYTLEVANSTPETDEDSIARAQAHLNTLLVIWGSRLTFKRLGGTVGKQGSGQKQEWFVIGVQQLGVTARGEISWDMVRDTLIREVTFGGTTCPTDEVCRLMAEFLQRLPLPRLDWCTSWI